jgi:FAD/FMN-containing dehydrogenase
MGIGLEGAVPRPRSPRDRSGDFVNFAGTVRTSPTRWLTPQSEAELGECVAQAAESGGRIRVVGAGHSWSEIAAPEDVAVSLDRMSGVLAYDGGSVRVKAGTRLRDLNRDLAEHGRALPILGSISQQSVAGAIGTGTHGSSLVHGNLSSLVLGARAIAADGSTVAVGAGDERLDAFRVHLGALGAITEVTLRTVPAFGLAETSEQVPVERAAARVEEIGRSAEYVKVWWMPHTSNALVIRYERTTEPMTRRPSPATERFVENWLMHRGLLLPLLAVQRRRPGIVPFCNNVLGWTLAKPRRVGPSWLMLATPDPFVHYETEAAVPLAAGGEALERTVKLIDRVGVSVNFIVELRYVRGDGGWMSPAHGGDVVQLGAYTGIGGHRRAYFGEFWREMRPLGARPHWGKELDHGAPEIASLYPMADRFIALRDEIDPGRVYANRFLDRVLGA